MGSKGTTYEATSIVDAALAQVHKERVRALKGYTIVTPANEPDFSAAPRNNNL